MTTPKSKRRQIIELHKKGRPNKDIAEEVGATPGFVSTVVCERERKLARIEERKR